MEHKFKKFISLDKLMFSSSHEHSLYKLILIYNVLHHNETARRKKLMYESKHFKLITTNSNWFDCYHQ